MLYVTLFNLNLDVKLIQYITCYKGHIYVYQSVTKAIYGYQSGTEAILHGYQSRTEAKYLYQSVTKD